jgi:hypothetical protein
VVLGWGVGTFFLISLRNESRPFALEIMNPFFTCHLNNVRRSSQNPWWAQDESHRTSNSNIAISEASKSRSSSWLGYSWVGSGVVDLSQLLAKGTEKSPWWEIQTWLWQNHHLCLCHLNNMTVSVGNYHSCWGMNHSHDCWRVGLFHPLRDQLCMATGLSQNGFHKSIILIRIGSGDEMIS